LGCLHKTLVVGNFSGDADVCEQHLRASAGNCLRPPVEVSRELKTLRGAPNPLCLFKWKVKEKGSKLNWLRVIC